MPAEEVAPAAEIITMGQRKWRTVINSTVERDWYMMRRIRAAKLDQIVLAPGESPEQYSLRLLYTVIDSGLAFELLGGMLLPEEVADAQWTPEHAGRSADYLRILTDQADKERVQALVVELITGFFIAGLPTKSGFLTASMQPQPQAAGER